MQLARNIRDPCLFEAESPDEPLRYFDNQAMTFYILGFFLDLHLMVSLLRIGKAISIARPWLYARQVLDNTALPFVTFTWVAHDLAIHT
ncbi:MAG: hypothetical protein WBF43_06580 [Methylocella sp.]